MRVKDTISRKKKQLIWEINTWLCCDLFFGDIERENI
jgi:hypothetical protein